MVIMTLEQSQFNVNHDFYLSLIFLANKTTKKHIEVAHNWARTASDSQQVKPSHKYSDIRVYTYNICICVCGTYGRVCVSV